MALILDALHPPLHHDLSYLVTFNLIIDYVEDIYANDYRLTVLWYPIENLGQTSMYMHEMVLHVCCIIFGTSPAPGDVIGKLRWELHQSVITPPDWKYGLLSIAKARRLSKFRRDALYGDTWEPLCALFATPFANALLPELQANAILATQIAIHHKGICYRCINHDQEARCVGDICMEWAFSCVTDYLWVAFRRTVHYFMILQIDGSDIIDYNQFVVMILQELDVNIDRLYEALDDTVLECRDFPAICRSAIDVSSHFSK
ncbi:hypothetical protein M422DRAFT_262331 [Sphaerobolus stellatus SS14]|uniref:Unplaced genomic scaffold SPHSTscaffold_114, whole genome shotgun sequence n=1 Tax=Sphaerobolus stellatus (strain SS14) TaxID=990650 RepID=A0A0C9VCX7_SPHS4|nr:hypothetical protein M422DRAFT_262331 [Sphaerobolus stellatus SS14]